MFDFNFEFPVGVVYNIESNIVLQIQNDTQIEHHSEADGALFIWGKSIDESGTQSFLVAKKEINSIEESHS